MLEELLNHVVAKDIRHQLYRVGLNLSEHLVFFVAIGRLQLLLYEARTVLITAELDDMVIDVLYSVSAVNPET